MPDAVNAVEVVRGGEEAWLRGDPQNDEPVEVDVVFARHGAEEISRALGGGHATGLNIIAASHASNSKALGERVELYGPGATSTIVCTDDWSMDGHGKPRR